MECMHCKGKMKKDRAPFSVTRKGYQIHWNSIPSWVCEQCGEPYFEGPEVDLIQKVLAFVDQESETLTKV